VVFVFLSESQGEKVPRSMQASMLLYVLKPSR